MSYITDRIAARDLPIKDLGICLSSILHEDEGVGNDGAPTGTVTYDDVYLAYSQYVSALRDFSTDNFKVKHHRSSNHARKDAQKAVEAFKQALSTAKPKGDRIDELWSYEVW